MTEQEYIDEYTLLLDQFDAARESIAAYQKEITSLQLFINDRQQRISKLRDRWFTETKAAPPISAAQVRANRYQEEEDEP